MFILHVNYLMGRVYSSAFEDGDDKTEPEWPPHPSRLYSALVAAWGEGGAEEELRPALEWLEERGAPTIYAGDHTPRKLVQSFVPVNDIQRLPEDRPRKPRTFPSASLSNPDAYFVWDAEPTAAVRESLDAILMRASSLGHSACLVSVEIADRIPDGKWNIWNPHSTEGIRMRVPYPSRLKELNERFVRFQKSPNKINRPSPGRTTLYAQPAAEARSAPQGIFHRMIVLRCEEGPRASLRSALSLTAALRGAIQKLAPQPVPEFLSGHAPGSTKENPIRSEQPHIAIAPLPFVAARHATGDVMGVAVLLPRTLTRVQEAECWDVTRRVEWLQMPWGQWRVAITDAEESRKALLPETWTRPSRSWATVTPFVFDRFPKDRYGTEAEGVVAQALVRAGFPEPREVDLHYNAWHLGVPRASDFPAAPACGGKPRRYHCHAWVRFEEPVAGPVLAGAGRYYGYGLFRALPEREGA